METVAFFDLFDYPLALSELEKYCPEKAEPGQIRDILDDPGSPVNRVVGRRSGFYHLAGRSHIIRIRQRRYNYSQRKIRRIRRLMRLFRFIPWIRGVAVGNIIGSDNLRDESDIDLFVIARAGRIWLARLALAGLAQALNIRPRPGQERDAVCLGFYISDQDLDISGLQLDKKDVYFRYWLAGLAPVYGADGIWAEFYRANAWLKEELPNWRPPRPVRRRRYRRVPPLHYRENLDILLGGLEGRARKWQMKRLPDDIKKQLNQSTRVMASGKALKFHTRDRREEYREKWYQKLEKTWANIDKEEKWQQERREAEKNIYASGKNRPLLICFIKNEGSLLITRRLNALKGQSEWQCAHKKISGPDPLLEQTIQLVQNELGVQDPEIKSVNIGQVYRFRSRGIVRLLYPVIVELYNRPAIEPDRGRTEYRWIKPGELGNYRVIPNIIELAEEQ